MNDQRPYRDIPHHQPSRIIKRKDREPPLPPAKRPPPPPPPPRTAVPASKTITASKTVTSSKNKLLAGFMAYEFLKNGTVLGRKLDTDGAETTAFNGSERCEQYEQITSLLMMKTDGGDCIPGVVNPTQLRRWIEM